MLNRSLMGKLLIALLVLPLGGAVAQTKVAGAQGLAAKASPATTQDRATAGKLDWMLATKRYAELERALPGARVSGADRTYFEGVLANLKNDQQRAIDLLTKVVPQFEKEHSPRTPRAVRLLANTYVRVYQYDEASKYYKELIAKYVEAFERGEQTSAKDDAATVALLVGAPKQTVSAPAEFSVPWKRSKLGSMDVDGNVNGVTVPWIVDTGANFSVVTEATAKKMRLKPSEGTAQTQGITGDENPLHVAIVPELRIGPATVKNVAVLVLQDLVVDVGTEKVEIPAVLGFPVLEALGRVTLTMDGKMNVSSSKSGTGAAGSAMYVDELLPLAMAGVGGKDVIFAFDTGAGTSMFSSRYARDFEADLKDQKTGSAGFGGAGGTKHVEAYSLPGVTMEIGGSKSTLKNVTVLKDRIGTHLDALHGSLARDVIDGHKSVTLDFRTMKFELN